MDSSTRVRADKFIFVNKSVFANKFKFGNKFAFANKFLFVNIFVLANKVTWNADKKCVFANICEFWDKFVLLLSAIVLSGAKCPRFFMQRYTKQPEREAAT